MRYLEYFRIIKCKSQKFVNKPQPLKVKLTGKENSKISLSINLKENTLSFSSTHLISHLSAQLKSANSQIMPLNSKKLDVKLSHAQSILISLIKNIPLRTVKREDLAL